MKEISVDELNEMREEGEDFQLLDVREPSEYEQANIDGELIPMNTIPTNTDKIAKDKKVIVMCRSGRRSANVVSYLEGQGYDNVYNLEGGIMAWASEIDNSIVVD